MRKFFTAALMLALTMPGASMAMEKPPELTPMITASQPVGEASFSKLMLHVYDVSFWSDSGDWAHAPYALTIVYDMHFMPDDLADRTLEEMQHVSSLPTATLQAYTDQLRRIYPEVHAGDRITALQKNATTTIFYANGKSIGQVSGASFAPAFFGIWLSTKTTDPDIRQQLLHAAQP